MPVQPPTTLGGLAFQVHTHWRPKLNGYIDRHRYTYGYAAEVVEENKLVDEVTTAKGIPDFLQVSHERKRIRRHNAFETYGIAAVPGTGTRVLIRRVNFVRPIQRGLMDLRTCWFAATPAWMEQMLTDSNEVLAAFEFDRGPVFPNSWFSHYRRYEVDGDGSEFIVYRLRPRQPVGDQDIFQKEWCTSYGLIAVSNVVGLISRKIAGSEAREISFLTESEGVELFGTRVFVPCDGEMFVFQLVSRKEHFGIERGRFEQVLSSIRRVYRTAKTSEPPTGGLQTPMVNAAPRQGIFDLEARREVTPWETEPRARTDLEMRVMLRTLACVQEVHRRRSTVYWFMRRRCIWVLERLGVTSPTQALEQQRVVFNQALEGLPNNYDLMEKTALAKVTIEHVLTRPTGNTHIGTMARIAVALRCPLFGFETVGRSETFELGWLE